MVRRLLRRWSTFALVRWGWSHRGTVVRLADLARSAPDRVRGADRRDILTELRTIHRLDRDADLARRTDLRIERVEDGVVTVVAPTGAADLSVARRLIGDVPGVASVRATSALAPIDGNTAVSA